MLWALYDSRNDALGQNTPDFDEPNRGYLEA